MKLPLLRKDFIIDERQILEAIEWGADAILLIVAILSDEQLAKFHSLATEAGLAVLVEVHDEAELDRALKIGARAHRREQPQFENFQGGPGNDGDVWRRRLFPSPANPHRHCSSPRAAFTRARTWSD